MSNPASALLAIFNGWSTEGTVAASRSAGRPEPSMAEHVRAMKCIWDIERIVAKWDSVGEPVEVWYGAIDAWSKYVVAFESSFQGQYSNAYDLKIRAKLDMLVALSQLLKQGEPRVESRHLNGLESFLNDVIELLADDESLSGELRAYILDLVQEIRAALEDFKVSGQFSADDAMRRLWAATGAASAESQSEAGRWASFRDKIAVPAAVGFLSSLPAVTTDVVLAITPGS